MELADVSKAYDLENIYHLVQDEPLIAHIHMEVLPPDSYYEELYDVLAKTFPKSSHDAREHVVALAASFDCAGGFGLSFG